jgi:hypothetical protein
MFLLSPGRQTRVQGWFLRRMSRRRRQALYDCATAAILTAFTETRTAEFFRIAAHLFLAACSLPGTGAFATMCAGARLLGAMLERESRARAWAQLEARVPVRDWRKRDRCQHLLLRGTASLLLLDTESALRELKQGLPAAVRLKDPGLIDLYGQMLGEAYLWFRQFDDCRKLARTLLRAAEAEDLPTVRATGLALQCVILLDREDYENALAKLHQLEREAHSGRLNEIWRLRLQEAMLACQFATGDDPTALAPSAVAFLQQCEREPSRSPFISFAATAFALVATIAAQMDSVPGDLATALARSRRRRRPIDAAGRWRRPLWNIGHAIYDASQGHTAKAERELHAALDHFDRYPILRFKRLACSYAMQVFPPQSNAYQRCERQISA